MYSQTVSASIALIESALPYGSIVPKELCTENSAIQLFYRSFFYNESYIVLQVRLALCNVLVYRFNQG